MKPLFRLFAVLLSAILAGCVNVPTPSDGPTATVTATPGATATIPVSPSELPTSSPTDTLLPTPTSTAVATPSPTPTPTGTASDTLAERLAGPLDEALNQQLQALGIPGMSAAITFADGSTWTAGIGLADVGASRPVGIDTPFAAGSITKTFVAATILQLVDEGRLSLDDTLSIWLPDYPSAAEITLRMLLSHTSGVFNLYEDADYARLVVQRPHHNWTPQEVLDNLVQEPYCNPGACYHYSNTGFILLGMVIEAETGQPFGTVLREHIFTPLGLGATYFQGDGPPPDTAARGYRATQSGNVAIDDGTNYRPTESEGTVIWAAGGLVASAPDLARWATALYGGAVLSADSLAQMTAFVFNEGGHQAGYYGLGTRQRSFRGINMEGHTGTLRAFNAAMWYLPSLGLSVAVLTNRTGIDANAITDALLAVVLPAVS